MRKIKTPKEVQEAAIHMVKLIKESPEGVWDDAVDKYNRSLNFNVCRWAWAEAMYALGQEKKSNQRLSMQ